MFEFAQENKSEKYSKIKPTKLKQYILLFLGLPLFIWKKISKWEKFLSEWLINNERILFFL